jgi:hypothetical protein
VLEIVLLTIGKVPIPVEEQLHKQFPVLHFFLYPVVNLHIYIYICNKLNVFVRILETSERMTINLLVVQNLKMQLACATKYFNLWTETNGSRFL